MLLKRGARIDDADNRILTALHWAVIMMNIQAVRLLLEHGADVNIRDIYGLTPAQRALRQDFKQLLSEYGTKSV